MRLVPALCDATRAAASSAAEARTIFDNRIHQDLHRLAAQTQTHDTATAARLLEAKSVVEQDFQSEKRRSRLAGDLAALTAATRAALEALSVSAPACAA